MAKIYVIEHIKSVMAGVTSHIMEAYVDKEKAEGRVEGLKKTHEQVREAFQESLSARGDYTDQDIREAMWEHGTHEFKIHETDLF